MQKSMDVNPNGPRSRPKTRSVGTQPNHLPTVFLPDCRSLRVIARSVLLVVAIISLPWLGPIVGSSDPSVLDDYLVLSTLFSDLKDRGLIGSGPRAAFVVGEAGLDDGPALRVLEEMNVYPVVESGAEPDSLDFVYAENFAAAAGFADRALKPGGLVAAPIDGDTGRDFWVPLNYKIAYVRRFATTVVVMQKAGRGALRHPVRRPPLCGALSIARRAAVGALEDVFLELPRANSFALDQYLETVKYLPELLGRSLGGYSRRVFVCEGSSGAATAEGGRFARRYLTGSHAFEMRRMDPAMLSEWLRRNVVEEEFVVVRAELAAVMEMVRSKAICLVHELFLECKQQEQNGQREGKNKMAYWECLALLGQLSNEGIAAHLWWT